MNAIGVFQTPSMYIYRARDGEGEGEMSLVDFYGISIIVGYLMPNSVYTYILNIYVFTMCLQII